MNTYDEMTKAELLEALAEIEDRLADKNRKRVKEFFFWGSFVSMDGTVEVEIRRSDEDGEIVKRSDYETPTTASLNRLRILANKLSRAGKADIALLRFDGTGDMDVKVYVN